MVVSSAEALENVAMMTSSYKGGGLAGGMGGISSTAAVSLIGFATGLKICNRMYLRHARISVVRIMNKKLAASTVKTIRKSVNICVVSLKRD